MENIRKIVREVLLESVIEERLMNVEDDVDFIYDKYLRDDIEEIKRTGILTIDMFPSPEFKTNELKSKLAQKSDNLNPCRVLINTGKNYYSPMGQLISVGVSSSAVDFVLKEFNGDLKEAINELDENQSKSLSNEFSESKIKGSIHHELAHWIDDTLHNQHIKRRAVNANEKGVGMTKKGLPINADKMEIQGQIHNIVQLKREYFDVWDSLTFEDLLDLSPTLNLINRQLSGDVKNKWRRNLITRMNRENLLGNNMVNGKY